MPGVRFRCSVVIWCSAALMLAALGPVAVAAQYTSSAGVTAQAHGSVEQQPVNPWQVPAERESTLAERFIGGAIVGALAGLGVGQLEPGERAWIASYAAASVGGVVLATAARERPRVLPVLLGAAVGSLPLWPLTDPEVEVMHPIFAIGFISTPLVAALGQNW